MVVTPHRIELKCKGRHDEYLASAALKPGHMLALASTGKVKKHDLAGGKSIRFFAKEDALQGKTITDAYAADDVVSVHVADPGDVVYARLPAAAPAIVIGDMLASNGDGALTKGTVYDAGVLFVGGPATAQNTFTTIAAADVKYTFPANSLRVGDVIPIKALVYFANASNSSETIVVTLKFGSVTIIATTALDHGAGDIVEIQAIIRVTAIGASGSIQGFGWWNAGAPGTGTSRAFTLVATTLDTTAAADVTVSQTASASNANTGGQMMNLIVERAGTGDAGATDLVAVAEEAVDNSAGVAEAFIRARVL